MDKSLIDKINDLEDKLNDFIKNVYMIMLGIIWRMLIMLNRSTWI